jgi:hypothetical protein
MNHHMTRATAADIRFIIIIFATFFFLGAPASSKKNPASMKKIHDAETMIQTALTCYSGVKTDVENSPSIACALS